MKQLLMELIIEIRGEYMKKGKNSEILTYLGIAGLIVISVLLIQPYLSSSGYTIADARETTKLICIGGILAVVALTEVIRRISRTIQLRKRKSKSSSK